MKTVLVLLGFFATTAVLFFFPAGRWDLPLAWACLGVYAIIIGLAQTFMDPELRRERIKPAPGGSDRHIRLMMLPFVVAYWIVAGLDIRWHGPDNVPLGWQLVGLLGSAGSLGIVVWAVSQNRFFSPVVRIQTERGHHLVATGPYHFVRHPGYLGGAASALCGAIALGSWWALLPAAGVVGVLLRRTILEDRFLQRNLTGYPEFARTVRYRWLPGIW